ncbi:uncharacterized protein LOC101462264 [Ceratitis capitata]|uniref:uncharacterized protein LOC101462264 n=1 Tax=Ceratitis capitata TaxID=7213 RepID=UPI00032A1895|nr:uncharacterized protein LOC101462264 [Ceratitis capitata]
MRTLAAVAISCLLLVQLANGLPVGKLRTTAAAAKVQDNPQLSGETSMEEDSDAQTPIVLFIIGELGKLAKWVLERGSVVVNNAVTELKAIPGKDELLQANITRMSRVATEAAQFKLQDDEESILQLFDNMITFTEMLTDYDNMQEDSKLKLTLKTALENNGYNQFENDFQQKVEDLVEKFENEIEDYFKDVSSEEKPNQKPKSAKLMQWHEELKKETNEDKKKLDKLGEVFGF